MTTYTEEKELNVTILHDGTKEIQTVTITLKDGEEVGRSNHRCVCAYDADVPADVEAFINAKKGRQPKRPEVRDV